MYLRNHDYRNMYTYTTYDNEDYIIRDLETYSMDVNYIFTKLENEQR